MTDGQGLRCLLRDPVVFLPTGIGVKSDTEANVAGGARAQPQELCDVGAAAGPEFFPIGTVETDSNSAE